MTRTHKFQMVLLAIAIVVTVDILVLATGGYVNLSDAFKRGWDHHDYRNLALAYQGQPIETVSPPFKWRVGQPWLAARFLEVDIGFFFISHHALFSLLVTCYWFMRENGFEHPMGLSSMILLAGCAGVAFMIYDYFLPDLFALTLLGLGTIGILARRFWLFACCLILSPLVKESAAFILIAIGLIEFIFGDRRFGTVIVMIASVCVLFVLRQLDPAPSYRFFENIFPFLAERTATARVIASQIWQLTVGTWGILFPLLVVGIISSTLPLKKTLILWTIFSIAYAQLLVATDTGRLLLYAFPFFLFYAGNGIVQLQLTSWLLLSAIAVIQIIFGIASWLAWIDGYTLNVFLSIWSVFVLALCLYVIQKKRAGRQMA